jgi:methyl-accepting chemotaxis protein
MDQVEKDKLIEKALDDFTHIMSLRSEFNTNIAKRVTLLLRTSFIGFGLVVGAFFFMILVLSLHMANITKTITTMNTYFIQMNNDMDRMLLAMNSMDKNLNNLPIMVIHLNEMYHNIDEISNEINQIYFKMDEMNVNMKTLSNNVTGMKYSFRQINFSINLMKNDVRNLSKPMRGMNMFNPFR